MRLILILFIFPLNLFSQTGPAGVGSLDGSSLNLWLKCDEGTYRNNGVNLTLNNDAIKQWNDFSGNDNHCFQSEFSRRPVFVTNFFNNLPIIEFDGSNDKLIGNLNTSNTSTIISVGYFNSSISSQDQLLNINTATPNQSIVLYVAPTMLFTCRYYNGSFNSGVVESNISINDYFISTYNFLPDSTSEFYNLGVLNGIKQTSSYTPSSANYYLGSHASGPRYWNGGISEILVFTSVINKAQRILVENYLSAKYDLPLNQFDLYVQDDFSLGNFDYNVAGIGKIDHDHFHNDSKGNGILRINNPSNLDNNEFMIWGQNSQYNNILNYSDVPIGASVRLEHGWKISEVDTLGNSIDVGDVNLEFDLSEYGNVNEQDLILLIDSDNDDFFSDESLISGAINIGNGVYRFSSISDLVDGSYFTLASLSSLTTPLPVELYSFDIEQIDTKIKMSWKTLSENNNDYFIVQKSNNGYNWDDVIKVDGLGNTNVTSNYNVLEDISNFGLFYYRLVQFDLNGHQEVCSIISYKTFNYSLNVFLNHSNKIFELYYEFKILKIFSLSGKDVTNNTILNSFNKSYHEFDLSSLSKGIYFIRTDNYLHKITLY